MCANNPGSQQATLEWQHFDEFTDLQALAVCSQNRLWYAHNYGRQEWNVDMHDRDVGHGMWTWIMGIGQICCILWSVHACEASCVYACLCVYGCACVVCVCMCVCTCVVWVCVLMCIV